MVLLLVIILPNDTSLPKNIFFKKAQQIFVNDEVDIVDGCRVLVIVIGSDNAEEKSVKRSLKQQKLLLKKLASHANVSPQNDYKSFSSSVQHKLIFLARTTPNIEDRLKKCEIM